MNPYDAIAHLYAVDMGASMRWPDVAFYQELARAVDGPVLELGSGSGRVLGPLLAAGIDAVGVDLSAAMLAQAAQQPELAGRLLRMDLRALAFGRQHFALALLPYSLVTYLQDEDQWRALAAGLRAALRYDGKVLLDAFIPRSELPGAGWIQDYARAAEGGWLVRHKRIQRLPDGRHRIERRYRGAGTCGRTLVTCETIRPLSPDQLQHQATRYLGPIEAIWWDYGTRADSAGASHCSLSCQIRV